MIKFVGKFVPIPGIIYSTKQKMEPMRVIGRISCLPMLYKRMLSTHRVFHKSLEHGSMVVVNLCVL